MSQPSVNIQQPQAPTPENSAQEWASTLPQIYQAQEQYAPQIAQEQQAIQQQLYPQVSQLSENLATQANQGMQSGMPQWMTDQYKSDTNAQLGANAGSPIGADYMSRGLLQQNQNWRQYYQNLGLQVSGQQPLTQPTNFAAGYTPGSVSQGINQNYGTSANIYGSNLGYQAGQNQNMLNLIGAGVGAVGAGAQAFGAGGGIPGISKLF